MGIVGPVSAKTRIFLFLEWSGDDDIGFACKELNVILAHLFAWH